MKKIRFSCPHCEAKLRVPTHLAGVSAPCPKCGATITAPSDIAAAVADAPPARRPAASGAPAAGLAPQAGVDAGPSRSAVLAAPAPPVSESERIEPVGLAAAPATPRPAPVHYPAPGLVDLATLGEEMTPLDDLVVPPAEPPPPAYAAEVQTAPVGSPRIVPLTPPPVESPAPMVDLAGSATVEWTAPASVPPRAPVSPPATVPTTHSDPVPVPAPASGESVASPAAIFATPPLIPAAPGTETDLREAVEAPAERGLPEPGATTPAPDPEIAFFTPPPPQLPDEPAWAYADERSEAPTPYVDQPEVEVESQPFAETPPPPPLPITQPIRITSTLGDLPAPRTSAEEAGNLPRLDVGLATPQAQAPRAAESTPPQRTRVFLPSPGSEIQQTRPEDFLAPPPAAKPTPPPIPQAPFGDHSVLADPGTDPGEAELPPARRYLNIPIPSRSNSPLPEDFEEGESEPEAAGGSLPWMHDDAPGVESSAPAPSAGVGFEAPEWEEPASGPLSFPPFQSESAWTAPEETAPAPPVPLAPPEMDPVPWPTPAAETPDPFFDQIPAASLHEGSFGKLFAQQNPGETPADLGIRNERDELDELFASTERKKRAPGKDKTLLLMVAGVVVVFLVAVTAVIFVAIYLGDGFSPEQNYADSPGRAEEKKSFALPKVPTSSQTASAPDLSLDGAPEIIDSPALPREAAPLTAPAEAGEAATPPAEAPALSFDEKVQEVVNRGQGSSLIGSPTLDHVEIPATQFPSSSSRALPAEVRPAETSPAPASTSAADPAAAPVPASSTAGGASLAAAAPSGSAADPGTPPGLPEGRSSLPAAKTANYNPPEFFPAPKPGDGNQLGESHNLIDAFLRAPDPATRVKYTYQGDSLRPAIEDYYKKQPYQPFGRYSVQLYQMEMDPTAGGPYWVFIIATSDNEDGFPLIVRTEGGNLKVEWEIFAEFADRHYLKFREGSLPSPSTLRVIIERFSDYYGPDRVKFKDLAEYDIYQVNPPYGDTNEFSEFAFVKKNSEAGKNLAKLIKLGDEPLAVIVSLENRPFAHGEKHLLINDLVTEGWFR